MHWDKELTAKLISFGFTREQAGVIVGEVAEHRQIADREGYRRGYLDGIDEAQEAIQKTLLKEKT